MRGAQHAGDCEADGREGSHVAAGCAGVVDCGGAGGDGEGEEFGGKAPEEEINKA